MAFRKTISIRTPEHSCLLNISRQVREALQESGVRNGFCYLFNPHTTAGLTINENADPDVVIDILSETEKIVPWRSNYRHGEGNSAAHIKASFFGPSLTIMIENGHFVLGTWQGIFFCEFDGPRSRKLEIKIVSDD